jgi:hypothetical protein
MTDKSIYEKINDARTLLEKQGYQTNNLWEVGDVQEIFDCNEDLAMDILIEAMENEATMDQIWSAIKIVGEDIHNLKTKEL